VGQHTRWWDHFVDRLERGAERVEQVIGMPFGVGTYRTLSRPNDPRQGHLQPQAILKIGAVDISVSSATPNHHIAPQASMTSRLCANGYNRRNGLHGDLSHVL
jgi:hypothetical protein